MTNRPVFDFSGKSVLVTGATSGIGAATAEGFAFSGARVFLAGRSEERACQLTESWKSSGVHFGFLAGDVRDPDYCEALLAHATDWGGAPDIVVNSAGVVHHATVIDTTDEQWKHTMDVNVTGVFQICRAAVPRMRLKGGGVIVNIASDAALTGSRHLVAYCASKGAVLQMSRAMALDHAADNIRVVPVCPGDVDTSMLRGEFQERGISADQGLAESAASVPLKRVCTPVEIADLVMYAASDSARFVTGFPLVADGGARA